MDLHYNNAKRVCKDFETKILCEYQDLKSNTLLFG